MNSLQARDLLDLRDDLVNDIDAGVKKRLSLTSQETNFQTHCSMVSRALEAFMNSSASELSREDHVPSVWDYHGAEGGRAVPEAVQDWVLEDARRVWEAMADPEDQRVRMPHDGYLKVGLKGVF